jgi:hypothetical protein
MTPKRLFVLNAVIAGGYGIALLMARGPDPGDVVDCGERDDRAEVAPRAVATSTESCDRGQVSNGGVARVGPIALWQWPERRVRGRTPPVG